MKVCRLLRRINSLVYIFHYILKIVFHHYKTNLDIRITKYVLVLKYRNFYIIFKITFDLFIEIYISRG